LVITNSPHTRHRGGSLIVAAKSATSYTEAGSYELLMVVVKAEKMKPKKKNKKKQQQQEEDEKKKRRKNKGFRTHSFVRCNVIGSGLKLFLEVAACSKLDFADSILRAISLLK